MADHREAPSPVRILIVEDDPADADLIAELLVPNVAVVSRARTMAEARVSLAAGPVDLVMLDLGLPDARGLEGLEAVQRAVPSTPVVVLTGLDEHYVTRSALQAGAQDYLVKGTFDTPQLQRTVRHAVERSRFVSRLETLTRERERRLEEFASLNQVIKASLNLNLDDLLAELVRQVSICLGRRSCCFLLRRRNTLMLAACEGDPQPEGLHSVEGAITAALESGLPQRGRARDVFNFNGHAFDEDVVCVPVLGRGKVVGVLAAFVPQRHALSAQELNLLLLIGRQAAAGIENAMLYQERDHVLQLLREALIPGQFRPFNNLEVGHLYVPSSALSGDYYDVIPLQFGRCALVIVDVAGKGTDAAIDAVRVKTIIQTSARVGFSPGAILGQLNDRQMESDPPERTMTCFYLEVNAYDGHVRFACAGHEPALLRHADGRVECLTACDVMIGALPGYQYHEQEMELEPNSVVLLYTDGVTDSRDSSGEFYGRERLWEFVASLPRDIAVQDMVEAVYQDAEGFNHGSFTDDLSLIALRWPGPVTEAER
ncbi:MAG: SpoIIE family protein phosphatase [Candidatus Xenobia bacterium]